MKKSFPGDNKQLEELIKTSFYYRDYLQQMNNIAVSCIGWNGFPETVDTRYLEWYLYNDGTALVFRDDITGDWYTLPYTYQAMDINGNPTKFTVQSPYTGYFNDTLTLDNAVPIFANPSRQPECQFVMDFAYRLTDILMTMEVNRDFCKTPALVIAPKRMKLTVENAIAQRKANQPAIVANEDFDQNIKFDMFGNKDPNLFLGDKLQQNFTYVWNEFLTWCGVPNVQVEKKERLLSDEVNRSLGGVMASRNFRMMCREDAALKFNKFGMNIKPFIRYGEDNQDEVMGSMFDLSFEKEGGEENG